MRTLSKQGAWSAANLPPHPERSTPRDARDGTLKQVLRLELARTSSNASNDLQRPAMIVERRDSLMLVRKEEISRCREG